MFSVSLNPVQLNGKTHAARLLDVPLVLAFCTWWGFSVLDQINIHDLAYLNLSAGSHM